MFGRRRDGVLAKVPPYRQIMPFLMRGRNESSVLFEQQLDMSRAQETLALPRVTDATAIIRNKMEMKLSSFSDLTI